MRLGPDDSPQRTRFRVDTKAVYILNLSEFGRVDKRHLVQFFWKAQA